MPVDSIDSMLEAIGYKEVDTGQWQSEKAGEQLEQFAEQHLANYKEQRDIPSKPYTSRISPYLRFGLLSPREPMRLVWGHAGYEKWVSELIWREFYAMILYHFPEVVEQDFQEKLPWRAGMGR